VVTQSSSSTLTAALSLHDFGNLLNPDDDWFAADQNRQSPQIIADFLTSWGLSSDFFERLLERPDENTVVTFLLLFLETQFW